MAPDKLLLGVGIQRFSIELLLPGQDRRQACLLVVREQRK